MKLCFSTLACPAWSLDEIIQHASAAGVSGIDFRGIGTEIDITRLPEFNAGLDDTLEKFHRHGLELPCFNSSITLVTPAPERWQMMLEECHRTVALARQTNTRMLRIFGGTVPKELTREEARTLAQRHLRQLVKISGGDCRILLETHDAWSTSSEVLELVTGFDPNEVGVLWDFEHPFRRGEALETTVTALQPWIAHVHIKDARVEGEKYIPLLLGDGELPLKDALRVIRGVGYDGWICLETEKRWHANGPEPEESIPQFVKWMGENA